MNLQTRSREEPEINLTSLIDVVLLLLVFFMVSTSFVREAEITLRLPEASDAAAPADAPEALEIIVTSGGTYLVNERALVNSEPQTLRRALQELGGGDGARPVIIRADAEARHQAVVTAMDVAGRLGHTDVRIVTASNPDER